MMNNWQMEGKRVQVDMERVPALLRCLLHLPGDLPGATDRVEGVSCCCWGVANNKTKNRKI